MFSRYKKTDDAPKLGAVPAPAAAPAPKAEAPKQVAPQPAAKPLNDKDLKRRQKLEEIRSELHHRLLDNLNLAALEDAPEKELKAEIAAICAEG